MFRKIIKGLKDVWCGTLEFDTEPKKDSFNPVTSGGVYDAINGAGGAKEIVYFDVDPSDPPSGIHTAIGGALSNNKLPVLKIDGAMYFYTATGTDKYVFVGGYTKEAVGYTEIEVSDDDSVTSKSVDDKVYNMYILPQDDPASPGETPSDEDQWVCDANKHVITKDELVAAHADCRYFILNNAVEPDSNSRKYFASVTVISNSYIRLRFYMMQYDAQGVAEFYQKTVTADSEGRLYILSSYSATLAGTIQAVLVSEPQNFDSTQKAQGRSNIGAASASDVTALQSQVSSLSDVSAYSVKGEATVAQLNAGPSGIQAGWAYQLTDSGTLTDGSLAVVAGDTVAWDGTKWFPLVKSDYYATKTYAQNVAHSIAPEFVPNETNAVADMPYMYGGKLYVAKEDYIGAWDSSKFFEANVDFLNKVIYAKISDDVSFVDDKRNWTKKTGYYLSSNGTTLATCETASSGWNYLTKQVSEGETYKIKSWAGQFGRLWFMFDALGNKVGQSTDSSSASEKTETIVIPNGVTTLGVNEGGQLQTPPQVAVIDKQILNISDKLNVYDFDIDNDSLCQMGLDGIVKKSSLARQFEIEKTFVDDKNSFEIKTGYFLSSLGTTLATCETASSGWNYLTKQVSEGETYKIKSWAGQLGRLWFMFDALGNKVGQSADSSSASEKTETIIIPDGVATLGVNVGGQLQTPPYSSEKIGKNAFTIPTTHVRDSNSTNRLFGKTLVCCGDSITYGADMDAEGITQESNITMYQRSEANLKFEKVTSDFLHSYGYQIAERNNMLFYNDGISGSTLENIGNSKGFSVSNGRYTNLPAHIDYLTIWFGWNDNAYGTLGTINDTTNTTFYGAFNVIMPYLIDKYPFTKICLCVPFGSSAGMRQAVREMGNKWGVAVFDFYGPQTPLYYGKEDSVGVDAAIVSSNRAKFQANGAHPNFKGHRQLADMLEALLRTI